jgi:hypothetical protein
MPNITAIIDIVNNDGERVDSVDSVTGDYLPIRLVIGSGISAACRQNGSVSEVVLSATSAAASFSLAQATPSATFVTSATADQRIECDARTGAVAVHLLASAPVGRRVHVKDAFGVAGSYHITISAESGTIDGAATVVISTNWAAAHFIRGLAGWEVE